jgi:hypothetical protein
MDKLLRSGLIFSVIFSLLAIFPSTTAWAEPPIQPGTWTGYFTRDIQITNNVPGVLIEATGSARADLNLIVSEDGNVAGKIANYHAEFKYTLIPDTLGPGGSCKFTGAWDVTGGTVTINPAHNPVFDLQLKLSETPTAKCDPPMGGASSTPTNSVHFEAKTYSGGKMTGEKFRFQNDMVEMVMSSMAQIGAQMSVQEYWELNTSSATVQQPLPEYIEYFLQGVEFMNTYKTSVDWHDSPPGTVNFTLGSWTQEAVVDELDFYSAALELGSLPAGKNPLTATAIGADGQPKDSQSMDVIIVPQAPWAQKAGFAFKETKTADIFKVAIYRGKTYAPQIPITLPYLDLSFIPVIGTKWGMEKPFQVVVNLEATSQGGLSNPAPVTGEANLFLGDEENPLKLTVDGQTVTNMTENALLFDHGQVNFKTNTASYVHNIGLFSLIPATQVLGDDTVFGKALKFFDKLGCGVELEVTGQAKGQGDLGVAADNTQIVFTNGIINPTAGFSAKGGCLLNVLPISVGGGGKGTFQIRIAPNPGLENCWISLKFTAEAFNQPFESPEWSIAQCKQAMLGGRRGLADTLLPDYPTGHQLAASFPKAPVLAGVRSQAQTTSDTTILVSGVSPNAALNLASGPDGRMAYVYTTGQPGQVGLRLFDGQTWGEPILLGDASRMNQNPIAAFDASGKVVVAWAMPAAGTMPSMTEFATYFRSWEITYAILDSNGKVVDQKSLTQDDVPDFLPQLKRSSDGTLWLAWLKSPSVDLFGSKDNPNWLQAAFWDGKSWSGVETISKQIIGALGFRMAAGSGSDISIVASQDTDGDPETITDLEIYLYQNTGAGWTAVQRLTNDAETDVFPLAAYTPEGKLVLAWKRGEAVVGLEGDLKGSPVVWDLANLGQIPDMLGSELLAGMNGELAFLWSGFTENGQGVRLAHRPSTATDWQPARTLVDGLVGAGMISAQLTKDGNLWVGLQQLKVPTESQDIQGLGSVSIAGLPTGSDLAVIEATGVMNPLSGANTIQDKVSTSGVAGSKLSPILLVSGAGLFAFIILGCVVILMVRRPRSKGGHSVDNRGRR